MMTVLETSAKKINLKHILVFVFSGFVLISVLIWNWQNEPDLAELQQQIAIAKTDNEREKTVDRLEKYYLNLSIPDSIRQRVLQEVEKLVNSEQGRKAPAANVSTLEANIYQLENKLKPLTRDAMLCLARGEDPAFRKIVQHAMALAQKVDTGADKDYWVSWITKVGNYNSTKAQAWLLANEAQKFCNRYSRTPAFSDAEKYGAFGLQMLREAEDQRLRLDIMQRMVIILYQSRSMFDLTYGVVQREISRAEKTNYHLRANGLSYHYTNALLLAGQIHRALENFQEIVVRAEKYIYIEGMLWYKKTGLLGTAKAYSSLGQFGKTLAICEKVEKLQLSPSQKISLHNTKGIAYRSLGLYDNAEKEYKKVQEIAVQAGNVIDQITALNNIGSLYYNLSDYGRAVKYYGDALQLVEDHFPGNAERKSNILINLAEVRAAQGEHEKFDTHIREIDKLIQFIELPSTKALLSRTLGRLYLEMKSYRQAYTHFQQALKIYEKEGLLKPALETKINQIQCLVALDEFQEARNHLINVQNQAQETNDAQGEIDAKGMEALIAFRQGKKETATQLYNKLSKEIAGKGEQIVDIYKLTGFHQKNYDYLKQAVVCELSNQRIDSAFFKLDDAKSWVLRLQHASLAGNGTAENAVGAHLDVDSLKSQVGDKQLIISYFLTQDTLYTFTVTRENIVLLQPKAIRFEALNSLVNAYKGVINKTIEIFRNQPTSTFTAHFDSTSALSQRLYDILFGWPELQSQLNQAEMTYIIPDEFLYGLPFSTLIKPGEASFQFLTSQTALTYLPSTRYFQANSKNQEFDSKKVLISVDSEIKETNRLVSFVKKKFPLTEELVVNKPARNITKQDILEKLHEKYHIFVFLGHSEPNTIFPDSSIFEMTAISLVDSLTMTVPISLGDLKTINWEHAEMVLLIGCETAQGTIYRGTGIAGIQQSLLSLGAKEVLATLWKIDADETISQIILFLNSWLQNGNAAFALQEVQKNKVQEFENDNFYKKPHPFIWGSFIHSYTVKQN